MNMKTPSQAPTPPARRKTASAKPRAKKTTAPGQSAHAKATPAEDTETPERQASAKKRKAATPAPQTAARPHETDESHEKRHPWLTAGAAMGIGSAALVAALLYARRGRGHSNKG